MKKGEGLLPRDSSSHPDTSSLAFAFLLKEMERAETFMVQKGTWEKKKGTFKTKGTLVCLLLCAVPSYFP